MESTMSKMDQKSAVYMIFSAELEAMSFDGPSYKKLSEREKRVKLRALRTKVSSYKKYSGNLVRISFTRLLEYFHLQKTQK